MRLREARDDTYEKRKRERGRLLNDKFSKEKNCRGEGCGDAWPDLERLLLVGESRKQSGETTRRNARCRGELEEKPTKLDDFSPRMEFSSYSLISSEAAF